MKKLHILLAIIGALTAIILIYEFSLNMKWHHLKDMIIDDEYVVISSRDGSGNALSDDKVEYLIGILKEAELSRKIDVRPRGGWSYLLDFEIEGELFSVVFNAKDSLRINGAKYNVDLMFD